MLSFCYSCRTYHPQHEMTLLETKVGRRWRCIASINASKQSRAIRDEFGKQQSARNKEESLKQAQIANEKRITKSFYHAAQI